MVDEKVIAEMEKGWEKFGYTYQNRSRSLDKLKHMEKHSCELLKGKDVLEFACNAGVFGYLIAQYANSYTGVEPGSMIKEPKHTDINYFAQTAVTQKFIASNKAMYFNNTVGGFLGDNYQGVYNALVVCFALYHFSDAELKLIEEKVLPKCDVVIIQNRRKKRENRKNSYNLFSDKNIVAWLSKAGFRCSVMGFNNEKYSEIQAVK